MNHGQKLLMKQSIHFCILHCQQTFLHHSQQKSTQKVNFRRFFFTKMLNEKFSRRHDKTVLEVCCSSEKKCQLIEKGFQPDIPQPAPFGTLEAIKTNFFFTFQIGEKKNFMKQGGGSKRNDLSFLVSLTADFVINLLCLLQLFPWRH